MRERRNQLAEIASAQKGTSCLTGTGRGLAPATLKLHSNRSMRFGLVFLAVFLVATSAAAELPASATLDDVLALATRREQPTQVNGYDLDRCRAVERLQAWPETSPANEARIASAFQDALHATSGNIRATGAMGLGRRGHGEAIPQIFAFGSEDPNLIGCFFSSYSFNRKIEPPVALFRRGLRSKNPDLRRAILLAIASCHAVALHVEVQRALASDPAEWVRDVAARTLTELNPPETVPALRRSLASGLQRENVVFGLTQLGGDADVAAVLPLLQAKRENLRRAVAEGLSGAKLVNSRPACDALLAALHDPSDNVRFAAVRALAHFRDERAIPAIRELLDHPPRPVSWDDCQAYVEALSAIGGREAIKLLNDMVGMGFRSNVDLNRALARFASPSSGQAVWKEYLRNPIHEPLDFHGMFEEVVRVLVACADADLLKQVRERLDASNDSDEKFRLGEAVTEIEEKLKREASIPASTPPDA